MNYFVDHLRQIAFPIGELEKEHIDKAIDWWSNLLRYEPPNVPFDTNRLPKDFTLDECHAIVEALKLADDFTSLIYDIWHNEQALIATLYFYKQGGKWSDRFDILPKEKIDELGYIIID